MKMFIQLVPAKTMLLALGLLVAGWQSTIAQNTGNEQQAGTDNDQTIVSAIAPYRDDVRRSILLASEQPQVLTRLAQQRSASQQAFNNLIQSYDQKKQGWFYDLSRYPDVLHALATLPAGSDESSVKNLTKTIPTDLQESAWKIYRHHNNDLLQVDNLNQQAQQAFDNLIAPLDVTTQNAFRQLLDMPDVLTQLTDQIDKTTQLGNAYRMNPDQVTNDLTALHDSLTVQNQQELADYQNELNRDPQAKQELQQAGQAYAQANGYNTGINPNPAWVNSSYYYQNPYPYWFGYPYWYSSPLWYPSAWWYGTGFYYGLGGNMVLFGLPSLGFSNWFFGPGRLAYPHLYNRFNNYYSHNMGEHHFWTPGNAGFMTAAHRAFAPTAGFNNARANWLTNARQYNRPSSWANTTRSAPIARYQNFNAGAYHAQSWGGGGMRSFGGGGFHGGRR
ncbi:DUF3300 domain-containing protein [Spirosoma endbachense]|uniref:DUF3300 domain-containing protein n=1 Tax=Spirosoma endbachense TaxID=2666025 RepID=A0A6P1VLZ4_9BACT|nr:DUF3300 domain-containing protein [Spirosoma endbachense]QHV93614.1 hypothetical protein GJR95_00550 [Spirosoma endbachense]